MDAFVKMRKIISLNLIEQKYINELVIKDNERINLLEESFSKLEEKEKIKCAGQELKDTIDAYLEGKEYEKATNNPDVAHNHLLELRGVICLTNIDNIDEKYVDIEKKK